MFEIVLLVIISLIVILIVIAIFAKSMKSTNYAQNKTANETQRVIKATIRNMSVDDLSNQYHYIYRFTMNISFENNYDSMDVVPVLYLDGDYGICNRRKATVPHGMSTIECVSTIETQKPLIFNCGMSTDGYATCRQKLSYGQTVVVGNYTIKFDGAYFKFMRPDFYTKFFIFDGGILPKTVKIPSSAFVDSDGNLIENRTYVKGGWVNISIDPYSVQRYEPVCIIIKTRGNPKTPFIEKNTLDLFLYPAGCQFWNDMGSSIGDIIEYCGDNPVAHSAKKFLPKKSYAGC